MSVLKKLEDQLNCPICLDTYTKPKQLQCNHVYCQQCLIGILQQKELSLTCPNCRKVTPVPASGVIGLQPAFQINKFLEIVEEHKKVTAATAKVDSASTDPACITVVCPEHGGKEVDLYCETCENTICWECIMRGSKHHSHEYKKLNEAFENYTQEISSSLEPLQKQQATIGEALKVLDERHDEITDQQAAIINGIHDTFRQLNEILEARKTELINQLDKLTQAKLKSLEVQKDQLETTQAQLGSCLLFLKENLMSGNPKEALMMKSTTLRQVEELTTTFQPDIIKPNTEADMIFSALEDLSSKCQNYGIVSASGLADPSKCSVIGKGLDTAAVGEKYTAVLQTQPWEVPLEFISCELVSEITGTSSRSSVKRRGQSKYEISYQPTIKGRNKLHIKVKGQHIRGSPFPVSVTSPVEKLETPILTIDGVEGAIGVAVNKRGEVVVAECNGHCVSMFSPNGERLRSFGTHGSLPVGVAVDSQENIFVVDNANHRIQKFTAQGEFLTAVGSEGSGPLQFLYPTGIAVSAGNGRVYVADNNNDRIQILDSNLSCSTGTFGKKGSGQGNFKSPWFVALDSTGNVYVADHGNNRIQVFTAEGKF